MGLEGINYRHMPKSVASTVGDIFGRHEDQRNEREARQAQNLMAMAQQIAQSDKGGSVAAQQFLAQQVQKNPQFAKYFQGAVSQEPYQSDANRDEMEVQSLARKNMIEGLQGGSQQPPRQGELPQQAPPQQWGGGPTPQPFEGDSGFSQGPAPVPFNGDEGFGMGGPASPQQPQPQQAGSADRAAQNLLRQFYTVFARDPENAWRILEPLGPMMERGELSPEMQTKALEAAHQVRPGANEQIESDTDRYVSDNTLEGTRETAGATRHTADRGYQGRVYASDAGTEQARIRAEADRDVAATKGGGGGMGGDAAMYRSQAINMIDQLEGLVKEFYDAPMVNFPNVLDKRNTVRDFNDRIKGLVEGGTTVIARGLGDYRPSDQDREAYRWLLDDGTLARLIDKMAVGSFDELDPTTTLKILGQTRSLLQKAGEQGGGQGAAQPSANPPGPEEVYDPQTGQFYNAVTGEVIE